MVWKLRATSWETERAKTVTFEVVKMLIVNAATCRTVVYTLYNVQRRETTLPLV